MNTYPIEIPAHECSDGKLFKNDKEAKEHEDDIQLMRKIQTWVDEFYYSNIDANTIVENTFEIVKKIKSES